MAIRTKLSEMEIGDKILSKNIKVEIPGMFTDSKASESEEWLRPYDNCYFIKVANIGGRIYLAAEKTFDDIEVQRFDEMFRECVTSDNYFPLLKYQEEYSKTLDKKFCLEVNECLETEIPRNRKERRKGINKEDTNIYKADVVPRRSSKTIKKKKHRR